MGEPEEVILEGAHLATSWAADLWQRRRSESRTALPELADLRQRLELYVAAICPGAPPLSVAEPPTTTGLVWRWLMRIPPHLARREARASTDGHRIRLPRRLPCQSADETLAVYRLLALGQAMRAVRGTPDHLPDDATLRDLYLLCESIAVDARIAVELPGLGSILTQERARALDLRPDPRRLTPAERVLEQWILAALRAPPQTPPAPLVLAADPGASLAWARAHRSHLAGRYRGVAEVPIWGRVDAPPPIRALLADDLAPDAPPAAPNRTRELERRPRVREASEDEDDQAPGLEMVPTQDRDEKAEDPMGLSRPLDRDDDADLDELAESVAELEEARLVRTQSPSREVLQSDDPPEGQRLHAATERRTGVRYPEWDHRSRAYRLDHVTVWLDAPTLASPAKAEALVERNAALVSGVRRHFQRLQPRRVRQGRQPDGPEVDIDAFVEACATRRAGGPADDRLYQVHRPRRRELAISLLVDVSASTDSWVSARRRIIDVERDALLVVCEALDALGDRYAIHAFSGQGPTQVSVSPLKDYDEPYGTVIRRRIAALEPQHFTRLGAAIRHATTGLTQQTVTHRLLLVLSDGKPNDVDEYEGRYGVEDARQAVAEARLQHIQPFCLTVDREAPAYMPRIFGPVGFGALRDASQLPRVLVDVIRRLIGN